MSTIPKDNVSSLLITDDYWDTNCITDKWGLRYRGTMAESAKNNPCLRWDEVQNRANLTAALKKINRALHFDALDETISSAGSFCRNPYQMPGTLLSCPVNLVLDDPLSGFEDCAVPECQAGEDLFALFSFNFPVLSCQ